MSSRANVYAVLAAAVWGCLSSAARSQQILKPFDVRDSIEMKVFSDPYTRTPNSKAKLAPDGRGFIVVTTQGHIESNSLESTLWYFPQRSVRDFLEGRQSTPPKPRVLFKTTGTPQAEQLIAYGSLITDAQWSSDSTGVVLLVETPEGMHRIYRCDLASGRASEVPSWQGADISTPVERSGTATYFIARPHRLKFEKNGASTVLTGKSLPEILFPKYASEDKTACKWKLAVRSSGRTRVFPKEQDECFPAVAVGLFQPAISPDGKRIVTVMPVSKVPQLWTQYRPANVSRKFVPSDPSSDHSGKDNQWPWQYGLIDLSTGTTRPLFDAPTGFTAAYGNPYDASWSRSANEILLTNTFLPITDSQSLLKPCAIAEYRLNDKQVLCIAQTLLQESGEHLMSAHYDEADDIVSEWLIAGKPVSRIYHRSAGKFTSPEQTANTNQTVELYIRQDIDVPPTLWARNGSQDHLLWDPNPQLKSVQIAKGSAYQWKDTSGYTWHGGLLLPPQKKPTNGYALVIQTHGFYNDHEFLVDGAYTTGYAAQPLANAGIAVLQMEDRPDKRSRPAEGEADDAVRGIESAIDHLVEQHLVDPTKVGLLGFSRTHWYVEKALEAAPQRYRAAIAIDGVDQSYMTDMIFVPGAAILREDHEAATGGPPYGPTLAHWLKSAVGFNLDKISAPLLLEAIGDASVLGEWETYSSLVQQGKPVDLISYPFGQHILQKPQERYTSQQTTVDWFRFWLQDSERFAVDAHAQYRRWIRLREH